MICTMTDTEMKLMVACLEFKIQDKLDNDLDTIIDLQTLIKKLNIMIENKYINILRLIQRNKVLINE